MKRFEKKLWIGLGIMALLSPLGVILPEKLKSERAWGEWDVATLQRLLGYVPEGLGRLADLWRAPVADYNFGGETEALLIKLLAYFFSGLIGLVVVAGVMIILAKLMLKNER